MGRHRTCEAAPVSSVTALNKLPEVGYTHWRAQNAEENENYWDGREAHHIVSADCVSAVNISCMRSENNLTAIQPCQLKFTISAKLFDPFRHVDL